jgi:hypothetical protein
MAIGNNINSVYKYNVGGQTYQINPASQGGYMNAYSQYEADRTNQMNATTQHLEDTLNQNNATTNANYDSAARQAYVDYMRKQKALPSQLQSLGVNGGATESALLNLYNNYGSSHAANEQQRNAELAANQQNRDDALYEANQQYMSDLNEQKQTAINNQINEYDNEITRFSSSVAQYPTTEKGYKKYQKWIKNMKNSKDPLKDIKVALIRQQMATQFPDGAPKDSGSAQSGKSGGGGKRGGRRGGGYRRSGSGSGSGSGGSVSGKKINSKVAKAMKKATKDSKKRTAKKNTVVKKGDTYRRTKGNKLRKK